MNIVSLRSWQSPSNITAQNRRKRLDTLFPSGETNPKLRLTHRLISDLDRRRLCVILTAPILPPAIKSPWRHMPRLGSNHLLTPQKPNPKYGPKGNETVESCSERLQSDCRILTLEETVTALEHTFVELPNMKCLLKFLREGTK